MSPPGPVSSAVERISHWFSGGNMPRVDAFMSGVLVTILFFILLGPIWTCIIGLVANLLLLREENKSG